MWRLFVCSRPSAKPSRSAPKNCRRDEMRFRSWWVNVKDAAKTRRLNSLKLRVWVGNSTRRERRTSRFSIRSMRCCEACQTCPSYRSQWVPMNTGTSKFVAGVPLVKMAKVSPSRRSTPAGTLRRGLSPVIMSTLGRSWVSILRRPRKYRALVSVCCADHWPRCIERLRSSCWIRTPANMATPNAGHRFW